MMITATITCPHGVKIAVSTDLEHPAFLDAPAWRRFVRDTLLACPACHFAASGFLEDVGP